MESGGISSVGWSYASAKFPPADVDGGIADQNSVCTLRVVPGAALHEYTPRCKDAPVHRLHHIEPLGTARLGRYRRKDERQVRHQAWVHIFLANLNLFPHPFIDLDLTARTNTFLSALGVAYPLKISPQTSQKWTSATHFVGSLIMREGSPRHLCKQSMMRSCAESGAPARDTSSKFFGQRILHKL